LRIYQRWRFVVHYSSIQPANWDLYVFDHPAATPRQLTTDPGLNYNPAISPDGRWIAFTSERSGSPDLYALDLQNPAVPRQLTKSPAMKMRRLFLPMDLIHDKWEDGPSAWKR
jgi:Tol biopolymer transport system component